jgi:hypothetical protein
MSISLSPRSTTKISALRQVFNGGLEIKPREYFAFNFNIKQLASSHNIEYFDYYENISPLTHPALEAANTSNDISAQISVNE